MDHPHVCIYTIENDLKEKHSGLNVLFFHLKRQNMYWKGLDSRDEGIMDLSDSLLKLYGLKTHSTIQITPHNVNKKEPESNVCGLKYNFQVLLYLGW